jgi:NTP pyrophosphatase (non-canonical NTP hydrolase)
MTEGRFISIVKWQDETFPDATAFSKVKHLEQEVQELLHDLTFQRKTNVKSELADCILLIYGAAAKMGMTYDDISDVLDDKMTINRNRTWGKPDANGVVNHVK